MLVRALVSAVVSAGAVVSLAGSAVAAEPQGGGTTVLLSSERPCTVSVDGDEVAILSGDSVKKVVLSRGEHLVSAVSIDKATWKQVVTVGAEQKVIAISFAATTAAPAPAAAPAPPASSTGGWRGDTNSYGGNFDIDAILHPIWYTGINAVEQKDGRWVIKDVKDTPGLKKGYVLLTIGGEPLRDKSNGQEVMQLLNGPPRSKVVVEYIPKGSNTTQSISLTRSPLADVAAPVSTAYDCPFGHHFDYLQFHCVVN
jgi:hypothetical protein